MIKLLPKEFQCKCIVFSFVSRIFIGLLLCGCELTPHQVSMLTAKQTKNFCQFSIMICVLDLCLFSISICFDYFCLYTVGERTDWILISDTFSIGFTQQGLEFDRFRAVVFVGMATVESRVNYYDVFSLNDYHPHMYVLSTLVS